MKFSTVRHGPAKYENTLHSKDFASRDLVDSKIPEVETKAAEFSDEINKNEIVTIWSSPIPRALETAKIFEEALLRRGVSIRKRKVFKDLEEARNFRWSDFSALLNGGVIVDDQWREYVIDWSKTNPRNLSSGEYFRGSNWLDIPKDYIESFPLGIRKKFEIEPYEDIVRRSLKFIERLASLAKSGGWEWHRVVVFSHQCCSDFLIELINEYRQWGIDPAESITLDFVNWDFMISEVPKRFDGKRVLWVIEETRSRVDSLGQ